MDYKAEQELEIESLQAIFADQLAGKVAEQAPTFLVAWKNSKWPLRLAGNAEYEGNTPPGWQGPCYQMAISPSQDELSSSGNDACESSNPLKDDEHVLGQH